MCLYYPYKKKKEKREPYDNPQNSVKNICLSFKIKKKNCDNLSI